MAILTAMLLLLVATTSEAGNGKSALFHIGLFNTVCSEFEVRLRPDQDIEAVFTNIQFSLKWPENSVNLSGFSSDYQIEQQGPVYTAGGFNYAVFVSIPLGNGDPLNMTANVEYVIMTFDHDQSGSGYINMEIADDEWTSANNGDFYVELLGLDHTGIIYQQAFFSWAGPCKMASVRVLLQGAWDKNNANMRTDINAAGNLPLTQPYNRAPWNYFGSESVSSFPDTIVDWVLIELRNASDPSILVERQAALISQHGMILRPDFTPDINFGDQPGEYYIVVKHRNHMPVMSGNPVSLPNTGTPYDFTEHTLTQPYLHNDPLPTALELQPFGSGIFGMIAGDVNADGELKYMGARNDRFLILSTIIFETGNENLNETITGYYSEDINLDNVVMYLGSGNDRSIILQNLERLTGSVALHSVYFSVVPEIINP